ncbi:MAG: hypothetical protein E7331_10395 [Clostridiales bacterium]|nr:hypothetical protein [Clostridiales bacterium]
MELHVLDEVLAPEGAGVILLCMDEENAAFLKNGIPLTDALGNSHLLKSVALQHDGLYTLHLPKADPAYMERLFRNVKVDATCFTFQPGEEQSCQ